MIRFVVSLVLGFALMWLFLFGVLDLHLIPLGMLVWFLVSLWLFRSRPSIKDRRNPPSQP